MFGQNDCCARGTDLHIFGGTGLAWAKCCLDCLPYSLDTAPWLPCICPHPNPTSKGWC